MSLVKELKDNNASFGKKKQIFIDEPCDYLIYHTRYTGMLNEFFIKQWATFETWPNFNQLKPYEAKRTEIFFDGESPSSDDEDDEELPQDYIDEMTIVNSLNDYEKIYGNFPHPLCNFDTVHGGGCKIKKGISEDMIKELLSLNPDPWCLMSFKCLEFGTLYFETQNLQHAISIMNVLKN